MGTHPIFESDFDCLTELSTDQSVLINKSAKMFMTKKQRDAIYENLFREGVMVAEKNLQANSRTHAPRRHLRLQPVGHQGMSIIDFPWSCQAAVCLASLLLVLTNEGIEYLREYLHLPPEIVPVTMKKQAKIVDNKPRGGGRVGVPTAAYSQDQRDQYRRE